MPSLNKRDLVELVKLLRSLADYIEKEGNLPDELIENPKVEKESKKIKAKDPIGVFEEISKNGIDGLEKKLLELSTDELKAIIYYHKFIEAKKISKWTKERLIKLIIERSINRSQRGNVFSSN